MHVQARFQHAPRNDSIRSTLIHILRPAATKRKGWQWLSRSMSKPATFRGVSGLVLSFKKQQVAEEQSHDHAVQQTVPAISLGWGQTLTFNELLWDFCDDVSRNPRLKVLMHQLFAADRFRKSVKALFSRRSNAIHHLDDPDSEPDPKPAISDGVLLAYIALRLLGLMGEPTQVNRAWRLMPKDLGWFDPNLALNEGQAQDPKDLLDTSLRLPPGLQSRRTLKSPSGSAGMPKRQRTPQVRPSTSELLESSLRMSRGPSRSQSRRTLTSASSAGSVGKPTRQRTPQVRPRDFEVLSTPSSPLDSSYSQVSVSLPIHPRGASRILPPGAIGEGAIYQPVCDELAEIPAPDPAAVCCHQAAESADSCDGSMPRVSKIEHRAAVIDGVRRTKLAATSSSELDDQQLRGPLPLHRSVSDCAAELEANVACGKEMQVRVRAARCVDRMK